MSIHSQLAGLELHEAYHFVQESDPGAVGAKLYWLKVSTGTLKRRNDTNSAWITIGGGASAFTALTDAPSSYTGQANKLVSVKGDESGLEFTVAGAGSVPDWVTDSPDTPPSSPNAKDDEFTTSATLPGGGSAKWTWDNQGSGSVSIIHKCASIVAPAATGNNNRTLYQAAPVSTPWTATTKVALNAQPGNNYSAAGFFMMDSVSGRAYQWAPVHDTNDNITLFKFSSNTAVSSVPFAALAPTKFVYLQVSDNGTNVIFRYSVDGVTFADCFSEPRLTYLTSGINRIGIFACSNNASIPCTGNFLFFRIS